MKIVVLDGHTLNPGDLSWDNLESLGDIVVYERTATEFIRERAAGAEILLTNKTPLHDELLSQLPELKYIGVLATGYDVVDVKAAKKRGIIVSNIPSYGTDSVAQMVFALLLELCHHVQNHSNAVRSGEWNKSKDFCFWKHPLVELSGKTMGIVGCGRIGLQVARIASAFGMNVAAYSRSRSGNVAMPNFRWAELSELFRTSDVISLHCPLTAETEGLINLANLSLMKSSAFLINTSRGKLISDADLAEALNHDRIAGAALDVLSEEPPKESNPLLTSKNCIITPHIAWATKEARARLLQTAVDNVEAFLSGQPANVVSK
jgi:glycerate dehydrogenase